MTDLKVTTRLVEEDCGRLGYVYTIFQGMRPLLTSGQFHLESDARSCGEFIAEDLVVLFDFIKRQSNGAISHRP